MKNICVLICLLLITFETLATDNSALNSGTIDALIKRFELREAKNPVSESVIWKPPSKVVIWRNKERLVELQKEFPKIKFISVNSVSELTSALKDSDVFIGYCISDAINSNHKLQWLMSMSVGVENCVSSEYLQQHSTIVTNVQKLSSPEIAEHAIALMMALNRGFDVYLKKQQKAEWDRTLFQERDSIWELEGRTVLVVGLGGIGKEVARSDVVSVILKVRSA